MKVGTTLFESKSSVSVTTTTFSCRDDIVHPYVETFWLKTFSCIWELDCIKHLVN